MTDRARYESERDRMIRTIVFDTSPTAEQNILIARSDKEQAEFVRLLDQEMGVAEEIIRVQIERRVTLLGSNEMHTIPFGWCITQRVMAPDETGQIWVVTADAAAPDTLDPFVADSKWHYIYWPDAEGVYETCLAKDWEDHWKCRRLIPSAQVALQYVWRDPSLDIMVCDPDSDFDLRFDLRPPKEELVKPPPQKSSWDRIRELEWKEVKPTWQRRRPRRPK